MRWHLGLLVLGLQAAPVFSSTIQPALVAAGTESVQITRLEGGEVKTGAALPGSNSKADAVAKLTRRMLYLMGFTRAEALRMDVAQLVVPEQVEQVKANLRRLFAGAVLPPYELNVIAKDQRRLILEVSSQVLLEKGEPVGVQGIARDITSRRQSEKALHESQRTLSTLMGNLPGMAYRRRLDRDWTLEFASPGSLELTGYPPADLEHNRKIAYRELLHPDDVAFVGNTLAAAARQRGTFQTVYRIRPADGQEKWVWEHGCGVETPPGEAEILEVLFSM